jgi:glycosyltransferase involved in cell wall biosynthesis
MAPRVSVVTSVYNGEKHLREGVDSILHQSFRDFEFIIVDDGSTDRTWKILTSYDDPRIILLRNEQNLGLTRSLNKALPRSTGEYIARMDADDVSLPDRLDKQVEFLDANEDVGLVSCSFVEIDDEGRHISIQRLPTRNCDLQQRLLTSNCFCHGAAMFRRECLSSVGAYRAEFEFAQDYDLWLRISESYKVANLEQPLYQWRAGGGAVSLTRRATQYGYHFLAIDLAKERRKTGVDKLASLQQEERRAFIKEEFRRHRTARRQAAARDYYGWGLRLYRIGNLRGSLRLLLRAIASSPLERDLWLQLVSLGASKLFKLPRRLRADSDSTNEETCAREHQSGGQSGTSEPSI